MIRLPRLRSILRAWGSAGQDVVARNDELDQVAAEADGVGEPTAQPQTARDQEHEVRMAVVDSKFDLSDNKLDYLIKSSTANTWRHLVVKFGGPMVLIIVAAVVVFVAAVIAKDHGIDFELVIRALLLAVGSVLGGGWLRLQANKNDKTPQGPEKEDKPSDPK